MMHPPGLHLHSPWSSWMSSNTAALKLQSQQVPSHNVLCATGAKHIHRSSLQETLTWDRMTHSILSVGSVPSCQVSDASDTTQQIHNFPFVDARPSSLRTRAAFPPKKSALTLSRSLISLWTDSMHLAQLSWGKFVPNMTFFFPPYLQTEPVPELLSIGRTAVHGVFLLGDMLRY